MYRKRCCGRRVAYASRDCVLPVPANACTRTSSPACTSCATKRACSAVRRSIPASLQPSAACGANRASSAFRQSASSAWTIWWYDPAHDEEYCRVSRVTHRNTPAQLSSSVASATSKRGNAPLAGMRPSIHATRKRCAASAGGSPGPAHATIAGTISCSCVGAAGSPSAAMFSRIAATSACSDASSASCAPSSARVTSCANAASRRRSTASRLRHGAKCAALTNGRSRRSAHSRFVASASERNDSVRNTARRPMHSSRVRRNRAGRGGAPGAVCRSCLSASKAECARCGPAPALCMPRSTGASGSLGTLALLRGSVAPLISAPSP